MILSFSFCLFYWLVSSQPSFSRLGLVQTLRGLPSALGLSKTLVSSQPSFSRLGLVQTLRGLPSALGLSKTLVFLQCLTIRRSVAMKYENLSLSDTYHYQIISPALDILACFSGVARRCYMGYFEILRACFHHVGDLLEAVAHPQPPFVSSGDNGCDVQRDCVVEAHGFYKGGLNSRLCGAAIVHFAHRLGIVRTAVLLVINPGCRNKQRNRQRY